MVMFGSQKILRKKNVKKIEKYKKIKINKLFLVFISHFKVQTHFLILTFIY